MVTRSTSAIVEYVRLLVVKKTDRAVSIVHATSIVIIDSGVIRVLILLNGDVARLLIHIDFLAQIKIERARVIGDAVVMLVLLKIS